MNPFVLAALWLIGTVVGIAPILVAEFKDPKPMNPANFIKNAYDDKKS